MDRRTPAALALGALAVALTAAGCGSSSSSGTTKAAANTVAAQTTTTQTPPPPKPHLRIVSPRSGAHTNGTVVVRVALKGSSSRGAHAFRYSLNGKRGHTGSAHYTLTGLAPGRYHLVVTLAGDRSVKASRVFVVRTPPPPPPPPPPPAATVPPPAQTQTQPPAAMTTTSSPPPAPPTSSGIPQNNGGDMDADNNGGPSDGDGNV